MTTEGVDFESIQVGCSQLRIPSDICTNRTIFQQILSVETWKSVFSSEQQERIMKLLPLEVLATPGSAVTTMEDFLSGRLTRFGSNSLEIFFNELAVGGYDPEVIRIKGKIKRQCRHDLLRRKRSYHTKLIQDTVISTQNCLHSLSDSKVSKRNSQCHINSKSPKIVKLNHQENTKSPLSKRKSNGSKPSTLRQKVAKRLHNEILAMNMAFPSTPTSLDGVSGPKKRMVEKKVGVVKKVESKGRISKDVNKNSASAVENSAKDGVISNVLHPQPICNNLRFGGITSKPSESTQPPSIQMAKFTNVLPPSLIGVINVTQNLSALPNSKPCISIVNPDNIVSQNTINKHTGGVTPQSPLPKQSLKSSPILASQLQAPLATANKLQSHRTAHVVNQVRLKQGLPLISSTPPAKLITNVKREEESSSEDEFEAIEPTIGFSTMIPESNCKPQVSSVPPPKPIVVKSTPSHSRLQEIGGTVAKSLPGKKPPTVTSYNVLTSSSSAVTQSSSFTTVSTLPPPSYVQSAGGIAAVNVKGSTPKTGFPIPSIIPTPSAQFSNIQLNSVKVISGAPISSSSAQLSICGPNSTTPSPQCILKPTPPLVLSNNPSTKLLPITLSNLSQHCGNQTYRNSAENFNQTFFHCANPHSTNLVNGISSPNVNSVHKESLSTTAVKTHPSGGIGTLTTTSLTPLPLTLSDLSLSLNLGLDVAIDKSEGKIDDLPVLDGNAFDSIPNLGDDLDVFDLDLDGLCDFEVMLSQEKQYSSFFALIREVLCSTQNHRMTFNCLEKTIRKWSASPTSHINSWFNRISSWNEVLITALNFLAGNYQEIHPEDFVPYIEYKYKTKYYQWIGAGRDSDNNLLALCSIWLDNLDKLPPVKKQEGENEEHPEEEDENDDSDEHAEEIKKKYLRPKTPPPPRFVTEWSVRPSTTDEKEEFRIQEKLRFDNPHKAFTYRLHCYESVVGPVKGVYSNQTGVTNKARGHSLLVDDRPPYVTILALVRDAVARLPNGEGTRSEICEMLRDSFFLAPEASNVTLNSVVSGALDRLHYERDPCVRYDSHKKNWIYLHRDRSQEQFERLHHNRSYTKSTKSRSSSGRKSRKKSHSTLSNPIPPNESNSNNFESTTSLVPTNTTVVPGQSVLISNALGNVGPPIGNSITPASIPNAVTASPHDSTNTTSDMGSKTNLISPQTVSLPPMHTTLPTMSTQIPNTDWTTSVTPSPQATITPPTHVPGLPNTVYSTAGIASSQLSSQPTEISQTASTTSIKIEPLLNQVPSTGTTTGASTLQQSSIIFNNVFRLPNLKLPENVRFMRIQQTPPSPVQASASWRLPQQRLVLRQTLPGQVTGQGVILGQTPTGQTIIISAIGSPHMLGTSTTQPPTNFGETNIVKPQLAVAHPRILNASPMQALPGDSTHTVMPHSYPPAQTYSLSTGAPRPPLSVNAFPNVIPTVSVSHLTIPVPTINSARYNTPASGASSTTNSVLQRMLQPPQLETVNIKQENILTVSCATPPEVISPASMILRSNQLEYLIPGHHIALGRGAIQGLKMIPVSSAGNQIFARLMTPPQNSLGISPRVLPTAQVSTSVKTEAHQ